MEQARLVWLCAMEAHVRAAQAHERAAGVFRRMKDSERAVLASERAARERSAYENGLARRPLWADDAPAWTSAPALSQIRDEHRRRVVAGAQ